MQNPCFPGRLTQEEVWDGAQRRSISGGWVKTTLRAEGIGKMPKFLPWAPFPPKQQPVLGSWAGGFRGRKQQCWLLSSESTGARGREEVRLNSLHSADRTTLGLQLQEVPVAWKEVLKKQVGMWRVQANTPATNWWAKGGLGELWGQINQRNELLHATRHVLFNGQVKKWQPENRYQSPAVHAIHLL